MRTLDLALKDIRQILRDRQTLLFLLVMPLMFTYFFGLAYRQDPGEADSRLKIAVINHDPQGILAATLVDSLNASTTVRVEALPVSAAAGLDGQILDGQYAAGLVIPANFSAATLRGESPQMEAIINEETDDGQTVRRAFQTHITRVLGLAETAKISAQAYEARAGFADAATRQAYLEDAVMLGAQAWESAPLSIQSASATRAEDPLAANPYNQFSPGMIVQFTIFGLIQAAMVLVIERRTGAMARLLTTPLRKTELIGGHVLGMFIVFFVQQLILVGFGQFVLKVDYLSQPLAILLIMAALALWVSTLGLLIASLAKKQDQVILFGMIAMFTFSALGGCWFSLEMVGKTFATIGHLMPSAWAVDGFQNIAVRGLGFESALLPVGVLLAYAAAFFGIALWRIKFE